MKKVYNLLLVAVMTLLVAGVTAAPAKKTAKRDIPAEPKLLKTIVVEHAIPWWGTGSALNPLRVPPPPKGAKIEYFDLNGDGKPDMLRTILPNGMGVQWIDDDGDMKIGDLAGDTDNDCVMIDRNRDGQYGGYGDFIVDWNDTDGDGKADMQVVVDNVPEDKKFSHGGGHYMWVLDTDKDDIFNYIDWELVTLRCWVHNGKADFYEDYHGHSLFLKIHSTPEKINDIRLNWENPFLFYDPDNDGLTEMAIRFCDTPKRGEGTATLSGKIDWVSLAFDLDNDNGPENEFDFDMTIRLTGPGFDYMDQVHKFSNMRGLPEADQFFLDPKWRQNTELIYPDHDAAWDLTFKRGVWEKAWFVFDEDGDCKRWERVELYNDGDLFKIGPRNGGLDGNPQADAVGDRGEFDNDFSGKGQLYIGRFDGRMHLYGAEWGAWRIDQRGNSYQGMGGLYDGYGPGRQQKNPDKFATVKYVDTDNNGFIDEISYDLDCDQVFEHVVSLKKLGLDDRCDIINTSQLKYEDFVALNTRMSQALWDNAQNAVKVADKYNINTHWYALLKSPKSIRQKYDNGYWLQFYIYRDMLDMAYRRNDMKLVETIDKAYYGGDWSKML